MIMIPTGSDAGTLKPQQVVLFVEMVEHLGAGASLEGGRPLEEGFAVV